MERVTITSVEAAAMAETGRAVLEVATLPPEVVFILHTAIATAVEEDDKKG